MGEVGREHGVDPLQLGGAQLELGVEDGARRERLVRCTLHGRCADWCDDEGKTSFLRDVLGVPTPWLEEARREWFDYNWWEAD